MKPTKPQLAWLRKANAAGLIEWLNVGGIMRNNWHNMMGRMVEAGWVTPYPHGHTYEITDAGRREAR